MDVTFDALMARFGWRPIPGCPGRFVLRGQHGLSPADLLGGQEPKIFRVRAAPDPVLVAPLEGGGLISYARPDGRFVHTLNTEEGLARKLAQLGIELP
jgi:hypothetical protein